MRFTEFISEAGSPAQQAAIAIAMKKAGKKPKDVAESSPNADVKKQISKFEELALAANRAGDDAKCKQYQQKIQSLKQKMSRGVAEEWSQKYKSSINCSHPKGFSQKAHCAGKKKHNESIEQEMTCPDCGMCETHGNVMEIRKGQKDANGYTRCWPGKHAEGTKKGKNGGQVRNCVPNESINEGQQLSVQQLAQISDAALDAAYGYGRSTPGNTFGWQANLKSAAFAKQMIDRGVTDIEAISDAIHKGWNVTAQAFVKNPQMFDDSKTMAPEKLQAKIAQRQKLMTQQYAQLPEDEKEKDRVVARAMLQAIGGQQELSEEFDLIENIVEGIAAQNGVDVEEVWADLESLTEDELYAFAVTSQLNEDWQKANKKDRTAGMSQKAVNAYRRENPGSKLKTAVTTKPSKLKKGSKASKRRKSYCSRSRGQMKMHNISCAKTPDKAICKARRRWNC
jgi:hypothetical protein